MHKWDAQYLVLRAVTLTIWMAERAKNIGASILWSSYGVVMYIGDCIQLGTQVVLDLS